MSGPARTALLTIQIDLRVTDTATEGEMLDAVTTALREAHPDLQHPGASATVLSVSSEITTKSTGGHL